MERTFSTKVKDKRRLFMGMNEILKSNEERISENMKGIKDNTEFKHCCFHSL